MQIIARQHASPLRTRFTDAVAAAVYPNPNKGNRVRRRDGGGDEAEEETEATYLYQARAVVAPSPADLAAESRSGAVAESLRERDDSRESREQATRIPGLG